MTPTVVFDTFGIVSDETNGRAECVRHRARDHAPDRGELREDGAGLPAAGSAYTYVRESIHPNAGFMVGWASLLDYLLLPMVNALIIRLYLEQVFPALPAWVTSSCTRSSSPRDLPVHARDSNLNMVLLVGAILAMIAFVVFAVIELVRGAGAGTVVSAEPFVHDGV